MSIWDVLPIEIEPEVTLVNWQVFDLPGHGRKLIGYNLQHREGRVSSRVRKFDPSTGTAVTNSGRAYRLQGAPGNNLDATYVWLAWLEHRKIVDVHEVTESVWAEIQEAQAKAVGTPPAVKEES